MRIRPPEEFSDVGVSNNFRPTTIDVNAATSFVREARTSLHDIGSIVDAAHDNAMRSQALADSVEYETRLTALRAEMDTEAPPDGTDVTDWARTYPQRWEQRSASIREDVSRRRGRRSNSYLRYFDERAVQIAGREQGNAIERSQAAMIDIDRGAGMELLASLAANATNPDVPETAEGEGPSRQRYEQQYIETAREFARRGTWSNAFAAERITQMQTERRNFAETEGRYQEARAVADRLREQFPEDVDSRLAAIDEIPDARLREQATDFVMADVSRTQAAEGEEQRQNRSQLEVLINQHGAAWQRYASPAQLERIRRDPGGMAQIRAQLDAMLDPTGSTAQTRSMNSARFRVLLEDLGNSGDAEVGTVFAGIDLDRPLTARDVAALREAGFADVEEGTVLSASLTREDYSAITDLQRSRRTGVLPNGDLVVTREIDDIMGYVRANGLGDFGGDDEAGERRVMQNQFRAFIGQIVRDDFARGGARDLTPAEVAGIARLAMSRMGQNGRGTNSTPLYRRRTSNRIPYNEIPAATAARLRRDLGSRAAGLTTAQIDDLVIQAYADENRARAQGR